MTPVLRHPASPDLNERLRDASSRLNERRLSAGSSDFDRYLSDEQLIRGGTRTLRAELAKTFHSKCCYCESALGVAVEGNLERFRPKRGVALDNGKYYTGRYSQLIFLWENLYYACAICSRNKADRFPVIGEHAEADLPYDVVLQIERPLLLDPCHDNPDEHLVFTSDGQVSGLTDRGLATIEVLGLGRPQLIEARRREALFLESIGSKINELSLTLDRPYLAVARQLIQTRSSPQDSNSKRIEAQKIQSNQDREREIVATEVGIGMSNYRARARYIERVRIKNFGSISQIDLNIEQSESVEAPCFALLGNNGVGKSTVLRAIALALSGETYLRRLRLGSRNLLREGAQNGEIRITLSGFKEEIVLTFQRGRRPKFTTASKALLVAYGSSRLLPRGRHKPKDGLMHAKIDNLFDPFLPLADAGKWLLSLTNSMPDRFSDASKTIGNLLPQEDEAKLCRPEVQGKPVLVQLREDLPRAISELSDGYQSMLGMTADILKVMYDAGFESMASAQGIVLIDELGNHFHPAWRLRAVNALRSAFPAIQFVFSTHDPLCLRGLQAGEVAVLRRDRLGHIYALDELPAVNKLRVEQLLTSEHFGLESTIDPEMSVLIDEYRELNEKFPRTPIDEARLKEITEMLTDVRYLGSTRRERMMLQLLDLEDSKDPIVQESRVSAENLSQETLKKLRSVMSAISPSQLDLPNAKS